MVLEAKGLACGLVDILDDDAEPATAHLLAVTHLGNDLVCHVGGDGKAYALAGGDDGGVDADDLTLHVDEGATGVAGVDGGIGLQEVVEGSGVDATACGGQDACSDAVIEAEGVANGKDPFTDLQVVAVAEGEIGKLFLDVDLQEGEIRLLVRADEGCLDVGLALGNLLVQGHADNVRAVHHVEVGHDVTVGGNEKARSERALPVRVGTALVTLEGLEETLESWGHAAEHVSEKVLGTCGLRDLFGVDVHHRGATLGCKFGELGQGGCIGAGHNKDKGQKGSCKREKGIAHAEKLLWECPERIQ